MNAEKKKEFVTNLCNSVRDEVISKIPQMPEEWDGHELRELLHVIFAKERTLNRQGYQQGDSARLRRFNRERVRREIYLR